MSTPTFAETYNLIAFLEKPLESEGFDQIVDFLNTNPVKYALIVSPTIYTSCIKQFWTFVKIKTINEDVWLQALVDGKKDILNEASIRRDLRLDDAEGTTYLPNDATFKELRRISAKTTAWNKFSSSMASAIICLANNQKFNFSKYIFESMLKNLEAGVMFFMYPRFVQVFINKQLGDMSHHKGIFVNPSLTYKVFANMKRVEIGFSGEITPLFETMMRKHKSRRKQRKETEVSQDKPQPEEHIPITSHDPLPSGEDRLQLNKLMELCTKLSDRVFSLEQIKTNQAAKTEKFKRRFKEFEGCDTKGEWDQQMATKEPATYGNIWDNEDVHDLGSDETEFLAIVFNDALTYEAALLCEPIVSSLNNDEIDIRISFDESDVKDYTSPIKLCQSFRLKTPVFPLELGIRIDIGVGLERPSSSHQESIGT
nr:hypothetical protein [Tanacetum cinerariifolium]